MTFAPSEPQPEQPTPPSVPPDRTARSLPPAVQIGLTSCVLPLLFIAVAVGALTLLRQNTIDPVRGSGGGRPVGVLTGSAAWRELKGVTRPHYEFPFPADLDGDGNDELLFRNSGKLEVYALDGVRLPAIHCPSAQLGPVGAWDSDGDGTLELLGQSPTSDALEVRDLNGVAREELAYTFLSVRPFVNFQSYGLIGDFDGNGSIEIWLQLPPAQMTIKGVPLSPDGFAGQAVDFTDKEQALVCDYDGDGADELILLDDQGKLKALRTTGTTSIGELPAEWQISCCLDANGDGKADLLCGEAGYFDQASSRFVEFKHKDRFYPAQYSQGSYVLFDFDGDGLDEQVYAGQDAQNSIDWFGGVTRGRVRVFDPRRQAMLYDEIRGDGYSVAITVAQANGVEYLVLSDADKTFIYP